MKFHLLLASLLALQLTAGAFAQELGQSDWQTPGNSDAGADSSQLGQSDWQAPAATNNDAMSAAPPSAAPPSTATAQSQLGQSDWINPSSQPASTAQVSDACSYNSVPGLMGSVSQSSVSQQNSIGQDNSSQPVTTSPRAAVVQKSNGGSNGAEGMALGGLGSALSGIARGIGYSSMMMSPYGMMSPYSMMSPMGMGMGGMGMPGMMGMGGMGMGGMGMGMGGMGMGMGGMGMPATSGAGAAVQGATSAAGTIGGMLIGRAMLNSMLSRMYPRW